MDYEIRWVKLQDRDETERALVAINEAFNATQTYEGLCKILKGVDGLPTHGLLAAFAANGEVAGTNAFFAHRFIQNGQPVMLYQSGLSATLKSWRGKGVFVNIQLHAQEVLRNMGATAIVGFPAIDTSLPIFRDKLKFRVDPLVKLNIPVALMGRYLNPDPDSVELYKPTAFYPIEQDLLCWKKGFHGSTIQHYEHYHNWVWGRVLNRKVGPLKLKFFSVGGLSVYNPLQLKGLLKKVARQSGVHIIQLVVHENHPLIPLFKGFQPAPKAEPWIVKDLQEQSASSNCYHICLGIKDAY